MQSSSRGCFHLDIGKSTSGEGQMDFFRHIPFNNSSKRLFARQDTKLPAIRDKSAENCAFPLNHG